MKTIFYTVNGEGKCSDLRMDDLQKLGTVENLVAFLKKFYNTEDVVFEGFGEA